MDSRWSSFVFRVCACVLCCVCVRVRVVVIISNLFFSFLSLSHLMPPNALSLSLSLLLHSTLPKTEENFLVSHCAASTNRNFPLEKNVSICQKIVDEKEWKNGLVDGGVASSSRSTWPVSRRLLMILAVTVTSTERHLPPPASPLVREIPLPLPFIRFFFFFFFLISFLWFAQL